MRSAGDAAGGSAEFMVLFKDFLVPPKGLKKKAPAFIAHLGAAALVKCLLMTCGFTGIFPSEVFRDFLQLMSF